MSSPRCQNLVYTNKYSSAFSTKQAIIYLIDTWKKQAHLHNYGSVCDPQYSIFHGKFELDQGPLYNRPVVISQYLGAKRPLSSA